MPEVTFLVAINLPEVSPEALALEAEYIHEDLEGGHEVLSVVPWARPTLPQVQPAGGFTSLNANPPTTQPPNGPL